MQPSSSIQRRLTILGAAIRLARHGRGWTQGELSKRSGVPPLALMQIEGGAANVAIGHVLEVCSTLNLSPDPEKHASNSTQERLLLDMASKRKRVRKPGSDPALEF